MVSKKGKKPVIGILGGVGSGKSTVAAEFGKLGSGIVDADSIAHELLDKKQTKEKIVKFFGNSILDSSGKISRKSLADIVFSDGSKLKILNNVLHPLVFKRAEELLEQYQAQENVRAIVLDIPLLVEVGWDKRCDKLIFVDCNRRLRAERAGKEGGIDENQLKIRENFQISLDKKVDIADNMIDNNSGLSELVRQVKEIFSYIVDDS